MIQALTCPSCNHASSLPEVVSLQAILRCRHCGNQIVLGEVIDNALDAWEVIDDSGSLVTADSLTEVHTEGHDNPSLAIESPHDLELVNSESDSQSSLNQDRLDSPIPVKSKVDWSTFDTSGLKSSRVRRQTRSPIWSILSVASGGLAAIPIATLLIWHVLGKDPLEMGPAVAKYVPWIVPSRFHPYESPIVSQSRDRSDISTPQRGSSGFRQFNEILPTPEKFPSDSFAKDATATNEVARIEMSTASDPATMPSANDSADVPPTLMEADQKLASGETPNAFSLIKRVEADLAAWAVGKDQLETKKKIAQQLYSDLTVLALTIDEQPRGNPVLRVIQDQLKPVGNDVKEQDDIQSLIQAGSRYWLSNHLNDDKVGLAIVGEVAQATESIGEWTLELTPEVGGKSPLRIVIPGSLTASLDVGQKLLMLGTVTRDAAESTTEPTQSAPTSITFVANYLYEL